MAQPLVSNIFIYLPSFAGGGAERVFVRFANAAVERGIDVSFVVNRDEGPLRDLLSSQVRVINLDVDRGWKAVLRLPRILREERPAALYSAMTGPNIVAQLCCLLAGPKVRHVASERNHPTGLMKKWTPRKRFAYKILIRLFYPRMSVITAVTDDVRSDLARYTGKAGKDKIVVVHNPAPENDETAGNASASVHPWFGDGGGPVILAIGRLVEQKGYKTLLMSLAESTRKDVRLLVLGEGPQKTELRTMAQTLGLARRTEFCGFVPNRLDYLKQASLYVLSSETEGFPNSLLEAVSCDVKVVSTDFAGGGARTILGEENTCIVPVNRPTELARAIERELERDVAPGQISSLATRFSMERMTQKFLDLAETA